MIDEERVKKQKEPSALEPRIPIILALCNL